MRGLLALGATALAGLAAVISSQDDDPDYVPFFVGLTLLGAVAAWAAHEPFRGRRRRAFGVATVVWGGAAIWVAALLAMFSGASSGPEPLDVDTYLGLTATAYHVVGLYGGLALLLIAAPLTSPDERSAA